MHVGDENGDDAAYQAANWLVLLSEASAPEQVRANFATWLAASPDHARAWAAAEETYGLIALAPRRHRSAAGRPARRSGRRHEHKGAARRWAGKAVAGGALAASLALFAAPTIWLRLSADRMTGFGEVTTMALADGSRIELGPSTAVRVRYSGDERHVDLLEGEASFAVQRNARKPFIVQAGEVGIRVLGTAFEVRRERTGTFVAVAHGKVRVTRAGTAHGADVDLRAGEWVRIDRGAAVERGQGLTSQDPPDRRMVIVKDRPVSEVIDRLRPWFGGAILVSGDEATRLRVTGAYDPRDPAKALALLLSAHGGRVRPISPWLIWVSVAAN